MSNDWVPPIPPAQPAAPPPQKKSRWWLYGLMGCGGLIVVVLVVVVAGGLYVWNKVPKTGTEMVAKMIELGNPDVEVVKLDEATGSVTLKDKKTGKTVTMNLEDAKQGKISFSSEDSKESITFGADAATQMPSWVPSYPGAKSEGGMAGQQQDGLGGSFNFTTADSASKVIDFYKQALPAQGFTLSGEGQMPSSESFSMLQAQTADEKRTIHVMATPAEGMTRIQLTYQEKNP